MFVHLFTYRVRSLLRRKIIVFWSLVYPILLATFFTVTFASNLGSDVRFDAASVAIVNDRASGAAEGFTELIGSLEYAEGCRMFEVHECGESEAEEMLAEAEVIGIVYVTDDLAIKVSSSGLYQSILKMVTDSWKRNVKIYTDLLGTAPDRAAAVEAVLSDTRGYLDEVSISGAESSQEMQAFYAIIAMACLFGSFVGIDIGNELQANASPLAARKCISSAHRLRVIAADMSAAFLIDLVEIIMVTLYIRFVLGIDICAKPWPYLLICLFGSMIGVASGQFVAFLARGRQGMQIAISLSFSLISCFLGGLMVQGMDHLLEQVCPVINRINPATLISNSFYCLAIYDDYRRFTVSMLTLAGEAALLTFCSYMISRRTRHASI